MNKISKISNSDHALSIFRNLPKITKENVSLNKGEIRRQPHAKKRGQHGHAPRGAMQALAYKYLGFEGDSTPFHRRIPDEKSFNFGYHLRREYPPFSLYKLQLSIDTGKIDPNKKIDLLSLLSTNLIKFNRENYYGIHLTDHGMDLFQARVNIEVQWASEQVIAAVEKAGGNIMTAYYDPLSISILKNPLKFFARGQAIPRRLYPPKELIDYYTNPINRGYLSFMNLNQENETNIKDNKIYESSLPLWEKKLETAQKFGFDLYFCPNGCQQLENKVRITLDNISNFWQTLENSNPEPPIPSELFNSKHPTQIFDGLEPGWVINLADKIVLKPKENEWNEYYEGSYMN